MKKRVISFLLAVTLALPITACGTKNTRPEAASSESASEEVPQRPDTEANKLEEIQKTITDDFAAVTEKLTSQADTVIEAIGEDMDSYMKAREDIDAWAVLSQEESCTLYDRTLEYAVAYFKELVAEGITGDSTECTKAIEQFQQDWEKQMSSYYESWDGKHREICEACETALGVTDEENVPEEVESEWNKEVELEGASWFQFDENYYTAWRGMNSFISEIKTAFAENDFDVDAILERSGDPVDPEELIEEENTTEDDSQAVNDASNAENAASSDPATAPDPDINVPREEVTPKVLSLLDEYEAFVDSYVAFMKKYREGNNETMSDEYKSWMDQSFEMEEKLEELSESDLSPTDKLYMDEVLSRTAKKMLELYE